MLLINTSKTYINKCSIHVAICILLLRSKAKIQFRDIQYVAILNMIHYKGKIQLVLLIKYWKYATL